MKIYKVLLICLAAVVTVGFAAGCAPMEDPIDPDTINLVQFEPIQDGADIAVIKTSMGTIKAVLFEKEAPNAVNNFKTLVENKFYDGLIIYSVDKAAAFITGSPTNDGKAGKTTKADGQPFDKEISNNLWHFSGTLSMFTDNNKGTFDTRFFITKNTKVPHETIAQIKKTYAFPEKVIEKYQEKGGIPGLDRRYTAFGQVIEGMDVVDRIMAVEVNEKDGDTKNRPLTDIIIEKITLEKYKAPATDQSKTSPGQSGSFLTQ